MDCRPPALKFLNLVLIRNSRVIRNVITFNFIICHTTLPSLDLFSGFIFIICHTIYYHLWLYDSLQIACGFQKGGFYGSISYMYIGKSLSEAQQEKVHAVTCVRVIAHSPLLIGVPGLYM